MITLADVINSAQKARELLDKLIDEIDAHEDYASINQSQTVNIKRDLDALSIDLGIANWIFSENRSAMMRYSERNLDKSIKVTYVS